MNFQVTSVQVGILGIVMLLGYISAKTGYVSADNKNAISKVIVKIILPCLIISSISGKDLQNESLTDIFTVIILSLLCLFVLFGLGVLITKILKLSGGTKTVHKMLSTTGNVIFLGYPIINAVYGEEGIFYAIIYWLLNDLFLWTVGVFLFAKDKKEESGGLLKRLLNPNTVSFLVAVLMLIFGIKLPPVIRPAVEGVGSLTTYLSMIFIGMALSTVDLKGVFKNKGIFVIMAVKQIVMPVLFILLFKWLNIDALILGVVVLQSAMPAQTVLTILANEYSSDFEYAALGMFITTVASLFTLPLVCYFIQILL